MNSKDIVFDNFEMPIKLKGIDHTVSLVILDDLYASEEELNDKYRDKISFFLNDIENWYQKSIDSIISNVESKFNIQAKNDDLKLLRIYILFEQNEDEIFGLNFSAVFDPEHGCGVKIEGINRDVVEVGIAEIAFLI